MTIEAFTCVPNNILQDDHMRSNIRKKFATGDPIPGPSNQDRKVNKILPTKAIWPQSLPTSSQYKRALVELAKRKRENTDIWRPIPPNKDWDKLIREARAERLELERAMSMASMDEGKEDQAMKRCWQG